MEVVLQASCVLSLLIASTADYRISLEEVSTLYLPQNNSRFDMTYVQKASYDVSTNMLHVTGKLYKFFVDISNPLSLSPVGAEMSDVGNIEYTDVTTCGNYFIVTVDYVVNSTIGFVEIYRKYLPDRRSEKIYSIEVNSDPHSVVFTPNCMMGVVSIKGTPYGHGEEFVDPPGQIMIVSFPDMHATGNFSDLVEVTTLNFTKFNSKTSELLERGVRFVYRGDNNSLSNDLEPGPITTTPNSKLAYVVLQKNNAIAVVDLVQKSVSDITGLGMKDWLHLKMDASDQDGGIHLKNWPIYSYYQPCDVQYFRHGYRGYLVTANEGTSVNLTEQIGWSEVLEGSDFIENNLTSSTVGEDMKRKLANKNELGSLHFTTRNGEETNDSFTKFVTFGGRSFSVWRTVDLRLVYDSDDDLETESAELLPEIFNAGTDNDNSPRSQVDNKSPYRGPRPESVAVGRMGALTVVFVGSGSPGSVFVYSIYKNISSPKFESVWASVGNTQNTWEELYGNRTVKGIDPKQIIFIPKYSSPTGQYALIVLGTKSGSVTLLNINIEGTIPSNRGSVGLKRTRIPIISLVFAIHVILTLT